MTTLTPAAPSKNFASTRERVEACLNTFLTRKTADARTDGLAPQMPAVLQGFIASGGKRLRPLLCVAGWQAAGGRGIPESVIRTAAALEMYQAFALIHDDVIDNSAIRRSQPAVHEALARQFANSPDPRHLGVSAAILIGDMALTWSHELFMTADVPADRRAIVATIVDAMREEMHHGQYLDLLSVLQPLEDERTPLTVIRYKTAKYTVERPLQIGAALTGAGPDLLAGLSRFALPLGDAFQLRDDLLGIFGDPALTGKPVLGDLQEGKHTVLMALAARRANPGQRDILERRLGDSALDDDGAAEIIEVIRATGADAEVESMIAARYAEALAVLDSEAFPPDATATLIRIARAAVERDS
ncbi:polyprenyl synthetase family protein [Kribbella antibiotica]|uniref:Polyprenyl synthetase family protein n=1 Tax=Kribbella antibiotica TaxID=190195 RepID=A0A4R4ZH07_9ACTN|nr:polyprenyl synthetase family protein [Kribbella antibiotica]TDD57685.1 polyprenyl synthetase family protein [Kribbella antibiotica]